jgi:hypothetical protein
VNVLKLSKLEKVPCIHFTVERIIHYIVVMQTITRFFFSMIPLCFPPGVKQWTLFETLAVTYKFPLAAAATPIGFLKLSEVKVNKIFPFCFIPIIAFVSQTFS